METQEDADVLHRDTYHEHPTPYEVGQVVTLPPCISAEEQLIWEKEEGRLCPRVALLPGNSAAAELAWLLIQPSLKAAYTATVMAYSRTMEAKQFRKVVVRSIGASRSPKVVEVIERLERDQSRKAGKGSNR